MRTGSFSSIAHSVRGASRSPPETLVDPRSLFIDREDKRHDFTYKSRVVAAWRMAMAKTMIPIPPIQWVRLRHNKIPSGSASISSNMDAPVVV